MTALLAVFGSLASIRPTFLRPAQYVGLDFDQTKRTLITGETFAEVRFVFNQYGGSQPRALADGRCFVGKGVQGVRSLPFERRPRQAPVKVLDLEGVNGKSVRMVPRSTAK